jgi:hypothetical protein
MAADAGHHLWTQLFNFDLNGNGRNDQERLQYVRGNHDSQGNQPEWSFPGQASFRSRQGGLDGGGKIAPARRPLDLQLGGIVPGFPIVPGLTKQDNFPDLESLAHAGSLLRVGTVISIVSPICVFVSANVRLGSSSTDAARRRTGATRHGRSSAWV